MEPFGRHRHKTKGYKMDSSDSGWNLMVGCCEHDTRPFISIMDWEVLDY